MHLKAITVLKGKVWTWHSRTHCILVSSICPRRLEKNRVALWTSSKYLEARFHHHAVNSPRISSWNKTRITATPNQGTVCGLPQHQPPCNPSTLRKPKPSPPEKHPKSNQRPERCIQQEAVLILISNSRSIPNQGRTCRVPQLLSKLRMVPC